MAKSSASQSPSFASLHTVSRASKKLGIAKGTLYNWLARGKIFALTDKNGINLFTDESIAAARAFTPQAKAAPTQAAGVAAKMPEVMTVSQAARALGISKGTLLRWEKAGVIASFRTVGGARRFSAQEVARVAGSRVSYQRLPSPTRALRSPIPVKKVAPSVAGEAKGNVTLSASNLTIEISTPAFISTLLRTKYTWAFVSAIGVVASLLIGLQILTIRAPGSAFPRANQPVITTTNNGIKGEQKGSILGATGMTGATGADGSSWSHWSHGRSGRDRGSRSLWRHRTDRSGWAKRINRRNGSQWAYRFYRRVG